MCCCHRFFLLLFFWQLPVNYHPRSLSSVIKMLLLAQKNFLFSLIAIWRVDGRENERQIQREKERKRDYRKCTQFELYIDLPTVMAKVCDGSRFSERLTISVIFRNYCLGNCGVIYWLKEYLIKNSKYWLVLFLKHYILPRTTGIILYFKWNSYILNGIPTRNSLLELSQVKNIHNRYAKMENGVYINK